MQTILISVTEDPRTGEPFPLEWVQVQADQNCVEYFHVIIPPIIPGTRPEMILHLNLN